MATPSRWQRPWRLQTKATALTVLFALAGVLITALVAYRTAYDGLLDQIDRQQRAAVAQTANEIGARLQASREVVEALAARLRPQDLQDLRYLEEVVLDDSGAFHFFTDLIVLDAEMRAVADRPRVPNRRGTLYADRPHLQQSMLTRQTVLAEPFMGRLLKTPLISITAPVLDNSGRAVASVNGTIQLLKDEVFGRLTRRNPDRESFYVMVDGRDRLILHYRPERLMEVIGSGPRELVNAVRAQRAPQTLESTSIAGEPTLYAAAMVPGTDWVLVAGLRSQLAFAPVTAMRDRFAVLGAGATVLSALLAWLLLHRLLQPLGRLHAEVERMRESPGQVPHLSIVPAELRSAELLDLAAGFDALLGRVREHSDEIVRTRDLVHRVIENTPDWVIVKDLERRYMLVNRAYCESTRMTPEQLLGRTVVELAADPATPAPIPADASSVDDEDRRVLAGETIVHPARRRRRDDGRELLFRTIRMPLRDDRGNIYGVLLVGHDITAERLAEERLSALNHELERLAERRNRDALQAQELNQLMLSATPYGAAAYDLAGDCVFANEALATSRGVAVAALLAENLYRSDFWRQTGLALRAESQLQSQVPQRCEVRYRRADSSDVWLDCWMASFVRDDAVHLLLMTVDITVRKRAEAEIIESRDRAEEASRAKSEFLSRMSHELRTPMNAILGFGQLLQLDPLADRQRKQVDEIVHAGYHLLSLIDDLLDISRIETNRLSVSCEAVSLQAALDDAVAMNRTSILGAGLQLELPAEPVMVDVHADPTRLRQVIVNLLSNATKFNRPGGRIAIDVAPAADKRVRLTIADTGPGIATDKLARLFRPFDRLDIEEARVPGSGIGLALSRQLMELMGGSIGVDTEPGRGSRFWIELGAVPRAAVDTNRAPGTATGSVEDPGLSVLYVEDNLANQRVVATLLERFPGTRLITAASGRAGIEAAREALPHAILLDLQLPDLDGYRVLQALRADPLTRAIPVIALTAAAMPLDVRRGREAGFAAYLTKPVKLEALLAALRNAVDAAQPAPLP